MGITIVALVLFIAMVACWVVLPSSPSAAEIAPETEPAVRGTMQPTT